MSVMNRDDIQHLSKELIEPFDSNCLTPLGYDLRVGKKVIIFEKGKEENLVESESVVIPPKARFAIQSLEKVKLRKNMFAFVFTKVSILWEGLTSLGTKVDPFFQDNLLLIFSNDSSKAITIRYGQKICNLMFFQYDTPAKDVEQRGLPSFLLIPSFPPEISDAMEEEEIKENYGYGISAVVKYLRPKMKRYNRRIKSMEKFRGRINYIIISILTTVVAGVILWFLRGG